MSLLGAAQVAELDTPVKDDEDVLAVKYDEPGLVALAEYPHDAACSPAVTKG
jgi:hypothetical protein